MTNSQEVSHKSWVARCSPSNPGLSCHNLHNFHGFNHSHSQSSHHKDFSLPALLSSFESFKIACIYEFRAIKVLPHNLHLNLDIVEKNLPKPGFRQKNFNLTTLPHSHTIPLPHPSHWLKSDTEKWNIGLNLHLHLLE